jgi:hypothetical protein
MSNNLGRMGAGNEPAPAVQPAGQAVVLSLVSHTNTGKTTLARTLLGRDIGEVRDAAHVTEFVEGHTLVDSPDGDELQLWDTPGFGDSARLLDRLQREGSPIGWLLSQVWDRWRDRPFWATQQALRHVRDKSDVVLYLVNAAESPAAAGYLASELALLQWLGKPVLVLLNQMGAPRPAAEEAEDVQCWRAHLQTQTLVHAVLPLDAFARCWVQELALWQAVGQALQQPGRHAGPQTPPQPQPARRAQAMARLQAAWLARRRAQFDTAVDLLAQSLGRIAAARAASGEADQLEPWHARLRALMPGSRDDDDPDPAQAALALQLDAEVRDSTAALIRLHGLRGEAQGEILERLAGLVHTRPHLNEGRAALLGGALTGALAGLKADLATGGLTLGGGMLAGGLLGALGGAGLARAVNVMRDSQRRWVRWADAAMTPRVEAALLRYLAVAHHGRGRGDWAAGEAPPHWPAAVQAALAPRADALAALWRGRNTRWDNPGEAQQLAAALQPLLSAAARDLLQALYPAAAAAWKDAGSDERTDARTDLQTGGAGDAANAALQQSTGAGPSSAP